MKNEILFIGATHGDEPIGVETLEKLEKSSIGFDWIIGSPPALAAGAREYEGNLNRSAPGNLNSKTYAIRRAAEIINLSKSYRYTIDIHGTLAYTGIFIIITNPTRANLELALKLDIPNVVVWPSFSSELKGPLSEHVPCGLEIECGPKDMPLVQTKLLTILEGFLKNKDLILDATVLKEHLERRRFFEVYGSLPSPARTEELGEFKPTTQKGETFFPLLIGCYQACNGIACYKMRLISDPLNRFVP